jgi:hypothetical protein
MSKQNSQILTGEHCWACGSIRVRHGVPNMTVDDFRQSLTAAKPPAEITLALVGLWWDAEGDWSRALGAYPALSEFPA